MGSASTAATVADTVDRFIVSMMHLLLVDHNEWGPPPPSLQTDTARKDAFGKLS